MTTAPLPAAAIGLSGQPFRAGWYKIAGNSDNRLPPGQHEAYIRPIEESSRLYVETEICGFLPMHFAGPRATVEALIVSRIPGAGGR